MYAENQKALPFSFFSIKGVPQLFGPSETDKDSASGSLASAILSSASSHQQNASNVRFGVGLAKSVTQTVTGSSKPTSEFRNLSKANAVIKERKAKKAEIALKDKGIKISVQVWISHDNDKMKRVRFRLFQVTSIQAHFLLNFCYLRPARYVFQL